MIKRFKNADPMTKLTIATCAIQCVILAVSATIIVRDCKNDTPIEVTYDYS